MAFLALTRDLNTRLFFPHLSIHWFQELDSDFFSVGLRWPVDVECQVAPILGKGCSPLFLAALLLILFRGDLRSPPCPRPFPIRPSGLDQAPTFFSGFAASVQCPPDLSLLLPPTVWLALPIIHVNSREAPALFPGLLFPSEPFFLEQSRTPPNE